jgi:hypothetical protein
MTYRGLGHNHRRYFSIRRICIEVLEKPQCRDGPVPGPSAPIQRAGDAVEDRPARR